MQRHRVRIRFRKEGDLRWISHRDLVRVFERLFRRAGLQLSMSEGFHPKARMSFPSALGLGIQGLEEVMEVELVEPLAAEELARRLTPLVPPGLTLTELQPLSAEQTKAQVERLVYEFPVPAERRDRVQQAIRELLAQESYWVQREGRQAPLDLHAAVQQLELVEGAVRMQLAVSPQASVRPREVLDALGLSDLEQQGHCLTRTRVELSS